MKCFKWFASMGMVMMVAMLLYTVMYFNRTPGKEVGPSLARKIEDPSDESLKEMKKLQEEHGRLRSYLLTAIGLTSKFPTPQRTSRKTNISDLIQERKKLLKKVCNSTPTKHLQPRSAQLLVYEEKHRFAFCLAHKAGTTSLLTLVLQVNGYNPAGPDILADVHTNSKIIWPRYGLRFRPSNEPKIKKALKFLFVRHPLSRLVSAFRDKLIPNRNNQPAEFQELVVQILKERTKIVEKKQTIMNPFLFDTKEAKEIQQRYEPYINDSNRNSSIYFREFVHHILQKDYVAGGIKRFMKMHWDTYQQCCHPCQIKYDFIGHTEDFDFEFSYLAQTLYKRTFSSNSTEYNSHQTNSSFLITRAYLSTLDNRDINLLGRFYEKDMAMFGYRWTDVLGGR